MFEYLTLLQKTC